MRFTDLSIVLALSAVAVASPAEKSLHKAGQSPAHLLARGQSKTLHKGTSAAQLMARQSSGESGSAGDSDYCYGEDATCASCFGTNWTECPDGYTCYDTTDPASTCDDSSSSGSGSSGSGSSSGGTDTDYCYGEDATCESCFGSGYIECSDGFTCYDPSDPSTYCPDDTGAGSGSGSGSGSSSGSGSGSGSSSGSSTDLGSETTSTSLESATSTLGSIGSIGNGFSSSSSTTRSAAIATSESSSTASKSDSIASTTSESLSSPTETSQSSSNSDSPNAASDLSIPLGLSASIGTAALIAIALM